jgi:hypothetical protein
MGKGGRRVRLTTSGPSRPVTGIDLPFYWLSNDDVTVCVSTDFSSWSMIVKCERKVGFLVSHTHISCFRNSYVWLIFAAPHNSIGNLKMLSAIQHKRQGSHPHVTWHDSQFQHLIKYREHHGHVVDLVRIYEKCLSTALGNKLIQNRVVQL